MPCCIAIYANARTVSLVLLRIHLGDQLRLLISDLLVDLGTLAWFIAVQFRLIESIDITVRWERRPTYRCCRVFFAQLLLLCFWPFRARSPRLVFSLALLVR